MITDTLIDQTANAMRAVAAEFVMPRFNSLSSEDITEKNGPEDLVTIADREAELALAPILEGLLPGSTVVGEEGVSADKSVLNRLTSDKPVWLVDPVDGTANFVKGSERFALMVALVHKGQTLAGWIYAPVNDNMAIGVKDGGASLDGKPLASKPSVPFAESVGDYSSKYVLEPYRSLLDKAIERVRGTRQGHCSAHAYLDVARGELDFIVQYMLNPWDHAAGTLMVTETGGSTRLLKSTADYEPKVQPHQPMLTVANAAVWPEYAQILSP